MPIEDTVAGAAIAILVVWFGWWLHEKSERGERREQESRVRALLIAEITQELKAVIPMRILYDAAKKHGKDYLPSPLTLERTAYNSLVSDLALLPAEVTRRVIDCYRVLEDLTQAGIERWTAQNEKIAEIMRISALFHAESSGRAALVALGAKAELAELDKVSREITRDAPDIFATPPPTS